MSASDETLAALGLDHLIDNRGFLPDPTGVLLDPTGIRVVCAAPGFLRSFRLILEKESAGAWKTVLKASGRACGENIARHLDGELSRLGKPALSGLPLEACLVLIERYFALHGWGLVKLDLTDAAEHGLVVAWLEHSCFVEALADVDDFVDPLAAGVLQGFLEYISGEALGCEEIACVRRGAPRCAFVVTAQERLDAVGPLLGREPADAILARLKT